jgi:membrane fusion protein (multidrug efflux system)
MKKQIFIYSLVLLAIPVFMASCNKRESNSTTSSSNTIPVVTTVIHKDSLLKKITLSGNVEGNKTVKLGFMVAGKINSIHVQEGQSVTQGQLLATLDGESYAVAKELADIQVNQASDEYDRLKLMYERNSISESDFKKIDYALQGAKAQQKLHTKNYNDTRLTSPISGILLKRLNEAGEIVASGMPILVISDISKVKVNAYIPENQLSAIRFGQKTDIYIGALDKQFEGIISEVGGAADPTTRAFTIKIEVENPGNLIRPGMIAEAQFNSPLASEALAIPASAILRTPDGKSYIYVVDNGKAFKRNISLGALMGNDMEVISGLTEGETIVSGGAQKLTNGSAVSVQH